MAKEPKPGDMVAFERSSCSGMLGMYKHFGIYVGHGKVVHVTSDGNPGKSKVQEASLEKVAQGGKYFVSNQDSTTRTPHDGTTIVNAARSLLGKPWNYDVVGNNCETFASAMRYGDSGISLQGKQVFDNVESYGRHLEDNLNPFSPGVFTMKEYKKN